MPATIPATQPAPQAAPAQPGRAGTAPQAAAPQAAAAAQSRATAAEIYQAFRAQREQLHEQLRALENKRSELIQNLQESNLVAADRAGLEKRVVEIDGRISDVDKQIATSDAEVARSAAVPGAAIQPPQPPRPGPPDEAYALGALFVVVAFLPLSIALARRVWRRSAAVTVHMTNQLSERMSSIERGVEAVAVEVERIGEGQRFVTQLLAESGRRSVGAGTAEPIVLKQRDAVPDGRR
jgi:hypothetical protein